MARRSYAQFCGLALALDVVGERWTLLIVRELMSGPKRYSDLAAKLHGVGSSLLASRLKQLEGDGLVERRYLEPPAASTVYELSDVGHELAAAIVPIAQWGARHYAADGPRADDAFHAEWSLVFVAELLKSAPLDGVDFLFEFVIDDSVARLVVHEQTVEVRLGRGQASPDATLRTNAATLADVATGRLSVTDAAETARIDAEGDPKALQFLLNTVGHLLPRPDGPATDAAARP